ncbi:hypothetical protein ACH5RR_033252 [Cinchona calisaya]|uniref:RNA helicase n=1 Tax=Cinchona calisaya TaxID=153742 RepID=A0ABD2YNZ5_9GENT
MDTISHKSDDEYSVIGDKGDIGFIDWENCKSVCSYNPAEESEVVTISVPFPLVEGKPQSGLVGETIVDSITIENKTSGPLDLWSVNIYDSKPGNSFTLSLMEPPIATSEAQYVQEFLESFSLEDRVLQPGRTLKIWLSCKPKGIGLHTSAVHFSVGDDTIERLVFIMAEDNISQSLASGRPFNRLRKKKHSVVDVFSDEPFVVGSHPNRTPGRAYRNRLPTYPIPKHIRNLIEQKQIPDVIIDGLTKENYISYFQTLLVLEEIKMEEDMRDYDMERITMKSKGFQFLSLNVPGLAERRPSLVYGDCVLAKPSPGDATKTKPYQGYIHRVEAEEVYLNFRQDFHLDHRPGNLYDVQFMYNRVGMRRLYQAIEAAENLGSELLFPSESCQARLIQPTPLVPISRMLNEEQVSAIEMILGCKGGSPYVIHGPPGTGKTITLIEAILQLYTKRKHARILVCAPSNSAADHILEKLLNEKAVQIRDNDIFRLNATTRSFEEFNPKYIEFSCIEDSAFCCPALSYLRRYRIIISTYASAYLLYAEGIKRGHFSHIFLDEAAQASEPETMVPLSHFCQMKTVVVLAGDPKQLGPLVHSKIGESYGSGKSYLERLFECQLYNDGNKSYITKLVRNYRSHPKILHLPSELFYGGDLIPCKETDGSSSIPLLELLPNQEFPLLFIGIQGCDEREGSNPSWFNRIEASKVVEIIIHLIDDKGLHEEDIGVITPYRQQVLKIKKALERFNKTNIQVGSVEQFQGQERQVIIVSTVRSTIKHNEFDKIYYLGFLSNPRRFNVAVTRARSLLILVGNPHIICKDEHWNKILWYCSDNNSYQGCFLPGREEAVEEQAIPSYENYDREHNFQPTGDAEWGDDFQAPGNMEWGDNLQPREDLGWGDNFQPSGEVELGDHSFNTEEIPRPVTDEAEWSDGWK